MTTDHNEYASHAAIDGIPCGGIVCTTIYPYLCSECGELPLDDDDEELELDDD